MEEKDTEHPMQHGTAAGVELSSGRRGEATNAAMQLLATQGARGLTHRALDRHLGWPLGSTSNYFRRRNDVLTAVAERVMQLDLIDIGGFERAFAATERTDIDLMADLIATVIKGWLTTNNRSRAYARSEILFESSRNPELRVVTRAEIAKVELLMSRVMEQLGSPSPAASARLFSVLMSSLHISALVAKPALNAQQVRAIVLSSLRLSIEQTGGCETR